MIEAKKANGIGGVEIHIEEPGGAYDGYNSIIEFKLSLDLDLAAAYKLARDICDAANARREEKIAEAADTEKNWGHPPDLDRVEVLKKSLPGPFVVAPARKLTPEEKAAREAKKPEDKQP